MNRSTSCLGIFVLCISIASVFCQSSSSWAIIDNDFETIALANSFYADENGFVAGGTASGEPLLLSTTDGGQTFTNQNLYGNSHGAFMSIDMYDSQNGVAGALGFLDVFACGAYTHDGQNWNSTHDDFICIFEDCQAIDQNNMVMIGAWFSIRDPNGNGVMISTDGGNSWKGHNWNLGAADAHYGWFESADYGYVSGGVYPETSDTSRFHQINPHVRLDKHTKRYVVDPSPRDPSLAIDYIAMLALATNSASQFTALVNITGQGFYFNEISCTDQNNCWLAAEGIDKSGDVGYIFHTNDGWQTYDIQITNQGAAFVAIDMLTPTYGWAGGALLQGNVTGAFDGQFWLTQDGQTWSLVDQIKNFFPFTISTTSTSYAYASGISPVGLCSFASSYAPGN